MTDGAGIFLEGELVPDGVVAAFDSEAAAAEFVAEWDRAIARAEDFLQEQSAATHEAYADALGSPYNPRTGERRDVSTLRGGLTWFAWCLRNGITPYRAVKKNALQWIEDLGTANPVTGKVLSKGTRRHMVTTASALYDWWCEEDDLDVNPFSTINRKKKGVSNSRDQRAKDTKKTRALTLAEAARLQHAADNDRITAQRLRSAAVIAILFQVGLRVSELTSLSIGDISIMRGTRVLFLRLKGDRSHVVELPDDAAAKIDAYLDSRTDLDLLPARRGETSGRASAPLIVTSTGNRMHRSEVLRLVKRLAAQAGLDLPETISPHSARATWIDAATAAGLPDHVIQEHVGHLDPATTAGYRTHRLAVDSRPATTVAELMHQAMLDLAA